MKIVAGLGSLKDYDAYAQAGADELFCGVMPFDWLEKYGVSVPLNRREVLMYPVQIASMADMRLLAKCSRTGNIPVAVAFNSSCYAPEHVPHIVNMMKELTDMGIDRFIVADPMLMLHMPKDCRIHVSGEWGEFSKYSLEFLKRFHVARLIYHRKVTIPEMRLCREAMPDIEYEAFLLNERCYYTGALCNSLHCDELPAICKLPFVIGGVDERTDIYVPEGGSRKDGIGAGGCGICALDVLEKAGITHLKLVGRGNTPEKMVRDIAFLKQALSCRGNVKQAMFPGGCPGACYYETEE